MPYKRFEHQELILRDELAIDRTRLANERTFLSYVRTSLALGAVGGTLLHLYSDTLYLVILGTVFFAAGVFCFIFGIWKTVSMTKQIRILRKRSDALDNP